MFETDARGATWTRTANHRGKRAEIVTVGCYVIEHIATGKLMTGVGMSIDVDINASVDALCRGDHSNKRFRKLCQLDSDLKIYEYPCKTLKHAKKLEKEIRASVVPTYLLVN